MRPAPTRTRRRVGLRAWREVLIPLIKTFACFAHKSLLRLNESARTPATVTLAARVPASLATTILRYATRTGALARLDGCVAGAFDREHRELQISACDRERELTLEVE